MQSLFLNGLIKNKGGVGLFHISQQVRLFLSRAFVGNLTMWSFLLALSKKGLPLPFSLDKKRIYPDIQLKGELITRVLPIPTRRNQIMNTFIIFNFIPTWKTQFRGKYMVGHSKKGFLLHSVWPGIEQTWALI